MNPLPAAIPKTLYATNTKISYQVGLTRLYPLNIEHILLIDDTSLIFLHHNNNNLLYDISIPTMQNLVL